MGKHRLPVSERDSDGETCSTRSLSANATEMRCWGGSVLAGGVCCILKDEVFLVSTTSPSRNFEAKNAPEKSVRVSGKISESMSDGE